MKITNQYLIPTLSLVLTLMLTISCEQDEPLVDRETEVYLKFYGGPQDERLVEAFPIENGETLLLGTVYIEDNIPNGIFLVRADQFGDYLWQTELNNFGDGVSASDLILDGEQILVMGHVNEGNTSDLLLWTLSMNGESLDTTKIGSPDQNERNGHFLINDDNSGYIVATEIWDNNQLVGNAVAEANTTNSDNFWDIQYADQDKAKTVVGIKRLPSGQIMWVGSSNDITEGNSDILISLLDPDGYETESGYYGEENNALDRVYGLYQYGGRLVMAGATNDSGQMRGRIISMGASNDRIQFYDTMTLQRDLDYQLMGYDELGNGNVVVCGFQMSGSEDMDQYLAEWNTDGEAVWEKVFENTNGNTDAAHRVTVGSDYLLLFGETGVTTNQSISLTRTRLDGSL